MKTNHIEVEINVTHQNRKCRLCGGNDEMTNHNKRMQQEIVQKEYKSRHDWVGKAIHWEHYKRLKRTMLRNGIYTKQNEFKWMNPVNFSWVLR